MNNEELEEIEGEDDLDEGLKKKKARLVKSGERAKRRRYLKKRKAKDRRLRKRREAKSSTKRKRKRSARLRRGRKATGPRAYFSVESEDALNWICEEADMLLSESSKALLAGAKKRVRELLKDGKEEEAGVVAMDAAERAYEASVRASEDGKPDPKIVAIMLKLDLDQIGPMAAVSRLEKL